VTRCAAQVRAHVLRRRATDPMLFALIRATEPYLDVYADYQPSLPHDLAALGFDEVALTAATGRHFALVATKPLAGAPPRGVVNDRRHETAKEDTHLKTWEAKR